MCAFGPRSHAILEAWGQPDIHLLIADADEYFVLPTPSTKLDDVLRKCTDNKTQVLLCVTMPFTSACHVIITLIITLIIN